MLLHYQSSISEALINTAIGIGNLLAISLYSSGQHLHFCALKLTGLTLTKSAEIGSMSINNLLQEFN